MDENNLIVEGIELDKDNIQFFNAVRLVLETNEKLIYLTGKAGTGKSTFLKYIRKVFDKNTVVLAPTGVAAVNVRGQTIHSFFKIKPSVYVPNDNRLRTEYNKNDEDKSTIYDYFKYDKERLKIIKALNLLIIDEISMVRCDLLDVVDKLLRVFRGNKSEPFGGVRVILIGDVFQLPPIADNQQWDILKKVGKYDSPFFFSSKVYKNYKSVIHIELKKIYRQEEEEFIDLLNCIRINQVEENELNYLNSRYNPAFTPDKNSNYITLATHNRLVEDTNFSKLSELQTELSQFQAIISGTFPDNDTPTDKILQLKEGAQIMFVKNDTGKKYYNGKIAKINKIKTGGNEIIVGFDDGQEIIVEKHKWENIKYTWNEELNKIEEDSIGTFIQFPVKLAWAITVHKSQGLTFEKVIADLDASFTSGQVYVALSRCTKISGLILKNPITKDAIKSDIRVIKFSENETPDTLISKALEKGKGDNMNKPIDDEPDFYDKQSRDPELEKQEFLEREAYWEAFESTLNNYKAPDEACLDEIDVAAYIQMGYEKIENSDIEGAMECCQKVIKRTAKILTEKPYNSEAFLYRGKANELMGHIHTDMAINDFSKVIEIRPKDIDALQSRAKLKSSINELTGALEDYTYAIETNTKYTYMEEDKSLLYCERGDIKIKLNDIVGAIDDYSKAIEIEQYKLYSDRNKWNKYTETLITSYSKRGDAKLQINDVNGAIQDYQKSDEIYHGETNHSYVHYTYYDKLEKYYLNRKEIDKAREYLSNAHCYDCRNSTSGW